MPGAGLDARLDCARGDTSRLRSPRPPVIDAPPFPRRDRQSREAWPAGERGQLTGSPTLGS
jgi:hypothetical protein